MNLFAAWWFHLSLGILYQSAQRLLCCHRRRKTEQLRHCLRQPVTMGYSYFPDFRFLLPYSECTPTRSLRFSENSAQSFYLTLQRTLRRVSIDRFLHFFHDLITQPRYQCWPRSGKQEVRHRINASIMRECMNKGVKFAFLERSFFKPTLEAFCGGHYLKTSGVWLQLQFYSSPWASLRLNPFLDR